MGIRNLNALTAQGCQAIIDGEVCGKRQANTVHFIWTSRRDVHPYQEDRDEVSK